jgi:hypothetical protein
VGGRHAVEDEGAEVAEWKPGHQGGGLGPMLSVLICKVAARFSRNLI